MFCEKGIARTHAKWSAVATASYRLMPEIEIDKTKVKDAVADELVAKCPMKVLLVFTTCDFFGICEFFFLIKIFWFFALSFQVFDIEDLGNGHRTAVAARPRACTMCRECIREPAWDERVKLRRVRDHFICTFYYIFP
jgi:DNA-directed RNA polymerase I and III subunit RPAC1